MVHNRYHEFKENKIFVHDENPCIYLYENVDQQHTYCGFIAATSVEDYKNGIIKKHEATIRTRELLFETYLKTTGFNAEPVLLMYESKAPIERMIEEVKVNRPEYEFSTTDKRLHRLWLIDQPEIIENIQSFFGGIDALYIADGHHRTASSALLSESMQSENPEHTGHEDYNYFMSYLIPESDVKISEFNRFVKDLNGYTVQEFLMKLDTTFRIEERGQNLYKPTKKRHFSMYLDGQFYSLYLRRRSYKYSDPLSRLDSEILYQTILKPILGIDNLSNDNRLGYTNNKLDTLSIKTNVDNGNYKVGFGMLPITVNDIKKIADAELKMPPKTSYIEPKLRSGLTLYEF